MPLFKKFEEEAEKKERGRAEGKPLFDVIIDVSVRFFKGRQEARIEIRNLIAEILKDMNQPEKTEQGILYARVSPPSARTSVPVITVFAPGKG